MKVFYELEVEGLPKDLPHDVSVDLSLLTLLDSHISVGDLKLPAGVVATAEPTETVASIAEQKEEEIVTPEIDLASIEVEKRERKKKQRKPHPRRPNWEHSTLIHNTMRERLVLFCIARTCDHGYNER